MDKKNTGKGGAQGAASKSLIESANGGKSPGGNDQQQGDEKSPEAQKLEWEQERERMRLENEDLQNQLGEKNRLLDEKGVELEKANGGKSPGQDGPAAGGDNQEKQNPDAGKENENKPTPGQGDQGNHASNEAVNEKSEHEKNVSIYGSDYVKAKRGSMRKIFTRVAWKGLGKNKEGWVLDIETPAELQK